MAIASGCAAEPADPVERTSDPEMSSEPHVAPADAPMAALTDRAWWRIDNQAPPGELRAFLSDGNLLMDSCGEVYRLARWEALGDGAVRWTEDGMEITADIVEADTGRLELRLHLVGGTETQTFEPAPSPYVCPDLPR